MGKKIATGLSDGDEEPPRLVFYKEDIEKIGMVLDSFLKNAKVRCVLLVDKDGHLLTKEGENSSYDADTISALVAGSFASTRQMAKILGDQRFSVTFQQGERDNIQFSLVGQRTILAVIFDGRTAVDMVRLYASQVSSKLTELFDEIANRGRKGPDPFAGTGPSPAPA